MLMVLHHLVNLLFQAAEMVPTALGSTWIGIFFPVWVFIIAEILTGFFNGWQTLKAWAKNVGLGIAVALTAWGGLFVCCLIGAIYRDHLYFVAKSGEYRSKAQGANEGGTANLAALRQDLGLAYTKLQTSCAKTEGKEEALDKQNRDQQGTINKCQAESIKLLSPQPLRWVPLALDKVIDGNTIKGKWIVVTNKTVIPIDLIIDCDKPITALNGSVVASPSLAQAARLTDNSWELKISAPAWDPVNPILVNTITTGVQDSVCKFKLRDEHTR